MILTNLLFFNLLFIASFLNFRFLKKKIYKIYFLRNKNYIITVIGFTVTTSNGGALALGLPSLYLQFNS